MSANLQELNRLKCLPFLSVLYMSIMTASTIMGNKLVLTPLGVLSAASLISPFWYILGDIITEVYGYRIARNLFWSVIVCQFIFALSCYFLIKLHSPLTWSGQAGYQFVLGDLVKFSLVNFIGLTIAWHLNARLLVRWKIFLKGKYFWLRSIGSSGMGLVLYSLLSVPLNVYGIASPKDILPIVLASCSLKIIYLVILACPAAMLATLIARLERQTV